MRRRSREKTPRNLRLLKSYSWYKVQRFWHCALSDAIKVRVQNEAVMNNFFTHQESALDAFVHLSERRGVVVRARGRHVVSFWNDKRTNTRFLINRNNSTHQKYTSYNNNDKNVNKNNNNNKCVTV